MINQSQTENVKELITKVGRDILTHQSDDKWRQVFDAQNYKTGADLNAHKMMVSGFGKITPNILVYSEEEDHRIEDRPDTYWLIDPIDGTASWYNGFPGYVSQIALISNKEPIVGLVYWPAEDVLWYSSTEDGAYRNGMKTPPVSEKKENFILIDNYPEPRELTKTVYDLIQPYDYVECGSIGLKSMMVADGVADVFIKDITYRDWDVAPAMTYLNQIGISITNMALKPIPIGDQIVFKDGLLVCQNSNLAKDIISKL